MRKTFVAVIILALPNFFNIVFVADLSKYLIKVLIPFFIAIFPIVSGNSKTR